MRRRAESGRRRVWGARPSLYSTLVVSDANSAAQWRKNERVMALTSSYVRPAFLLPEARHLTRPDAQNFPPPQPSLLHP
jgi:hypothetical protein